MLLQASGGFPENEESFDTIIVGGGQAGLAAGYFLARLGKNFIILDKDTRTGDSWRCRWDSLRLFTHSQFDSLPGMQFSKQKNYLPTKDEIAGYLEEYARHFNLPVRHNTRVDDLSREGQGYRLTAGSTRYRARNVIVATGPFQAPFTPELSNQLDARILQLHSTAYLNPTQVQADNVLVVGAGNSGAEIALELARAGKQVWLAGRDVGRLPIQSPIGRFLDGRLLWWFMTNLLTLDTPVGRKMVANSRHRGAPLGRARRDEVVAAGVTLVPRVAGIRDGQPVLEDGQTLPVGAVIWATGYKPDFSWVQLPIFEEHGYPRHQRGIVPDAPGLYFLGLVFQTGLSSAMLGGVGKDAAFIAGQVAQRAN